MDGVAMIGAAHAAHFVSTAAIASIEEFIAQNAEYELVYAADAELSENAQSKEIESKDKNGLVGSVAIGWDKAIKRKSILHN
jgi:hypothetical protein